MKEWLENAVIYQIFPPSFADENGDGIGDFAGIEHRLDDLAHLGVNTLWLNPCYVSPFADAGYDIADYDHTAPRYGSDAALAQLIGQAHARGMHLLLDLVPGHTSIRHPWCLASMLPERNAFTDRYIWTDSIGTTFEGVQGIRSGLQGISQRDGVLGLNCFCSQPALNYGFARSEQPWQQPVDAPGPRATREAIRGVMRRWLSLGADGFRVDMAGSLVKNDADGEATIALWREMRAFLDKEYPSAVLVSEWGDARSALRAGFDLDFALHFGASHYPGLFRTQEPFFSRRGRGDIAAFLSYLGETRPAGVSIPSGNHDMDRMAGTLTPAECALAFAFLLTMPGVPSLYYGDEIGMREVQGLTSVEGAYNRTGARTPMQWTAGKNAGFSSASAEKLYLPLDADAARPCVAAQRGDAASLYETVRALLALRAAHPALARSGGFEVLHAEPHACPLVYRRTAGTQRLIVAINPGAQRASAPWAGGAMGPVIFRLGGAAGTEDGRLWLAGGSAVVFAEETR